MRASSNGQYVFVATTRHEYFLSGLRRRREICEELLTDPSNPFLSKWASQCDLDTGYLPNLAHPYDFVQVRARLASQSE